MEFMTGEWFGRLVGVLVVNLILSGDNAVVIAMAARTLEGANRKKAIIWGAAGAVVLRLIFAGVITLLLVIGMATTIPRVIFVAALLTSLLNRFPILTYLRAGLLVNLAVGMLLA